MFHTNNEKHIVRLSALRRGPIATVLEKRSPARIPEKISGVARGSFRSRATDLRPRLAPDRPHHDVGGGMFPEFATRLSTGIYGKIVALLLVPMIFLQPLLPAYAADETVALPPETTVAPEVAAPVEAPPSVETASEPVVVEEATPVENATESPEENSVTETASGDADVPIAPTNVEDATEVVPEEHSPAEATVEIVPPSSTEPIAGEGETVVTDTLPSEDVVQDAASETPTTSSASVTSEDAAPSEGASVTEDILETTPGNDAVSGGASSGGSGGAGSTPPTGEVSTEPSVSEGNSDAAPGDSVPVPISPDPVPPSTSDDGGTPNVVSVPSGDTAGEEPTMSTPDESLTQEAPRENAVPNEDRPLTNEQAPTEVAADAVTPAEKSRDELKREVMEEFLRGCISFERTGYYCIKEEGGSNAGSAPESGSRTVTVEPDGSGYKQIVLTRRGVRTQLTHDAWDNAFPTQDVTGGHIVWQGMKSGRWQIFFGAIAEDGSVAVAQVTDSKESNFNPKVDGDRLVWQGWIDDNWEIFLADRRLSASPFASEHLPFGNRLLGVGPEWTVTRLTTNAAHDMFPSLHGDVVTWQTREGEGWAIYAYSILEGTQTKLSSDGTKSENPRFTITWEERTADGYARLMGYDMSTGEKVDLTSEAKRVPERSGGDFPAPISKENQATLPGAGTTTGTSTPSKGDDESGAGGNTGAMEP